MFGMREKRSLPSNFRVDMDEHAQPLKMLLFIRSAWSLENWTAKLPALDPLPVRVNSALPASESPTVWAQRWNEQWQWIWDRYGMKEYPFWTTEYGTTGFDVDAFQGWDRRTLPEPKPRRDSSTVITTMAAAWEKGLTNIIVLPYRGHYASWSKPGLLVISAHTRRTPKLLISALELPQ